MLAQGCYRKLFVSWTVVRTASTSVPCSAGFQGAGNVSLAIRQSQIDRKKRKIAKMERQALNQIPVTDFYIPISWKDPARKRELEISYEEQERRALLMKRWQGYVQKLRREEDRKLKRLIARQTRALTELRAESEELYQSAIQCDVFSTDFECRGPVQTLPLKDYLAPLGGIMNVPPPFASDHTVMPDLEDDD